MLSPEERQEIDKELEHSPTSQAACIEALKIVQRHRGWVSDEAIKDLASHLKMSAHELDSVATFYSLIFRKPVGKHVILICDSMACFVTGYESLREHIEKKLGVKFGETTEDGRFTFLNIPCLGACEQAPAMIVDETLYGDLTPGKVDQILDGLQ